MQNIDSIIQNELKKYTFVRTSDLVKKTGFSRAYIQRKLHELTNRGQIVLIGRANQARYVVADKQIIANAKKEITSMKLNLNNKNLSEDVVLENMIRNTGIFMNLPENTMKIVRYGFTEMLNNAIEHSKSEDIIVDMKRTDSILTFTIVDHGVGIFNNIRQTFSLPDTFSAIQNLLKGKQTTDPSAHSGEGIFFTSKIADNLMIQSSNKKLRFNNLIDDIFVEDAGKTKGTIVTFTISLDTLKYLDEIFRHYTDDSFAFSTTVVTVKLFQLGTEWISRSQARRVVTGLEKFTQVILDFKGITSIGQGFADEIFRVWQSQYPDIEIIPKNTHENVLFMIKRAQGGV